ncbi:MAG: PAS domain-containing protein [Bacteroidota bacterium]
MGIFLLTIIIGGSIVIVIISIGIIYIFKPIKTVLGNISLTISNLSKGKIIDTTINYSYNDEFAEIGSNIKELRVGFENYSNFAKRIGDNDLNSDISLLSDDDTLGKSLLDMKYSLIKAQEEELVRKSEDERRNWATVGHAKFGEILRQNNDNIQLLSFNIIRNLVEYTGMNQGGLFVYNDNNAEHPYLEMTACYAFNRQKFIHKTIEIGEGLVGACYQEGQTIFLTDVPNSYVEITSGLGEANPKCILIVPLKLNDKIYGIIELASFKTIEQYQIEFVEKIGESIASTISSVKVNIRTAQLLEVSQQQSEEMRAQEEEMRQNLEEMHATQEEMERKQLAAKITENKMLLLVGAIDASYCRLETDINGYITECNDSIINLSKMSKNEIVGKLLFSFMPQDKVKTAGFDGFLSNLKSGIQQKGGHQYIFKNKEYWMFCTYTPGKNEEGVYNKIVIIGNDITLLHSREMEMKQQTEELKAQEEEMRQNLEEMSAIQEEMHRNQAVLAANEYKMSMLKNAVDSAYCRLELDMKGNITDCNDLIVSLSGYKKNELVGNVLFNYMPQDKVKTSAFENFFNNLKSGIQQKGGHQFIFNGKEIWLYCTYTPEKNEENIFDKIIVIANDITMIHTREVEMKQQAEELKAQEEEMRQNLEEMKAIQEEIERKDREMSGLTKAVDHCYGIAEYNAQAVLIKVNSSFVKFTGISEMELLNKNYSHFVNPDFVKSEKYSNFWNALLNGKTQSGGHQYFFNGKEFWFYESFAPVVDESGQVVKIICIANDITKLHENQKETNSTIEALKAEIEVLKQKN